MLCTTSVSPLDRDKDTVLDPRKMLAHFSVFRFVQEKQCVNLCGKTQRRSKSLGKEESARGEEPLFKAVCSSRIFLFNKKSFVLCTTSVSPLDRNKDTVLDPRKMLAHFSALKNRFFVPWFRAFAKSRKGREMQKESEQQRASDMTPFRTQARFQFCAEERD